MSALVLVLIGTMAILFMVLFIVFFVINHQKKMWQNKTILIEKENQHQKKLTEATIVIAEIERKRIAANLHDDVGSILNVINLNLSRLERTKDDDRLTKQLILESKQLLASTIENIRGISHDLMPPVLLRLGFIKGLENLCQRINNTKTITITLTINTHELILIKSVEIQLYRIINEVIANVLKHANATMIELTINETLICYECVLQHNGKGLTNDMLKKLTEDSNGLGLKSIQSRVQLIDGSLSYDVISSTLSSVTILTPKNS